MAHRCPIGEHSARAVRSPLSLTHRADVPCLQPRVIQRPLCRKFVAGCSWKTCTGRRNRNARVAKGPLLHSSRAGSRKWDRTQADPSCTQCLTSTKRIRSLPWLSTTLQTASTGSCPCCPCLTGACGHINRPTAASSRCHSRFLPSRVSLSCSLP